MVLEVVVLEDLGCFAFCILRRDFRCAVAPIQPPSLYLELAADTAPGTHAVVT